MKRAMSPLFSTIILIGFAIALGGVVMSWGKSGYATERGQTVCEKASLTLIDYGDNTGICSKGSKLFFTTQNNGEVDLDGIKISIVGTDGIYTANIEKKISVGDTVKLDTEYSNTGKIQKVLFVPKYVLLNQEKLCPKSGFSTEGIGECK